MSSGAGEPGGPAVPGHAGLAASILGIAGLVPLLPVAGSAAELIRGYMGPFPTRRYEPGR
jgi:hypothetical protein